MGSTKGGGQYRETQVFLREAKTVFRDRMLITVIDEEHSIDEERYITIGMSAHGRLLRSPIRIVRGTSGSLVPARPPGKRNTFMSLPIDPKDYELRDEYDLSKMTVVPKGRYAPQHRVGKNIALLDPDVVQAFPTDDAVNEALRLVMRIARIPRKGRSKASHD